MAQTQSSPIADRALKCLNTYSRLGEIEPGPTDGSKESYAYLKDSSTRYQIWAANLGALHPISDSRSADHRLREAPVITKHLSDVLDELCETLEDIEAILTGERADQSELQGGVDEGKRMTWRCSTAHCSGHKLI